MTLIWQQLNDITSITRAIAVGMLATAAVALSHFALLTSANVSLSDVGQLRLSLVIAAVSMVMSFACLHTSRSDWRWLVISYQVPLVYFVVGNILYSI